jgi:hypothetical protein
VLAQPERVAAEVGAIAARAQRIEVEEACRVGSLLPTSPYGLVVAAPSGVRATSDAESLFGDDPQAAMGRLGGGAQDRKRGVAVEASQVRSEQFGRGLERAERSSDKTWAAASVAGMSIGAAAAGAGSAVMPRSCRGGQMAPRSRARARRADSIRLL